MSQTVSLRLPDELVSRLDRFARRLGNGMTRSRANMILIPDLRVFAASSHDEQQPA
jgi:predicted transcriptional regulator